MEKIVSSIGAQKAFAIVHPSDVAAARRYGSQLADSEGLKEPESTDLGMIITELANNILKHAREGMLFVTVSQLESQHSIQILALDKGPGISNLAQGIRDTTSPGGTAGSGLARVKRQADEFDAYSQSKNGSAFYASIHAKASGLSQETSLRKNPVQPRMQYGSICVPMPGEEECGDAWAIRTDEDCITILVADGLGHGPEAAIASSAAVQVVEFQAALKPADLIHLMHKALRITRGAALALGQYRFGSGNVNFAGIGNISACIVEGETRKQMVSHNGTVGHNLRKVQDFSFPWPEGGLYIMCSDGISTHWDLNAYPGLNTSHPALIAGIIYRDFNRGRDDATVVVAKQNYHS